MEFLFNANAKPEATCTVLRLISEVSTHLRALEMLVEMCLYGYCLVSLCDVKSYHLLYM